MDRKVILYSGGLDSVAIAEIEQPDVLLHFITGTEDNVKEQGRLPTEDSRLVVEDCLTLSTFEMENKIIPARNLLFITLAFNYGNKVILGATDGDSTHDKTEEFAKLGNDLFGYMYDDPAKSPCENPEILLPYRDMTKTDIVEKYLTLGHDPQKLVDSWSCYDSQEKECGECRSCFRKFTALTLNDIDMSEHYMIDPMINAQEHLAYARMRDRRHEIDDIVQLINIMED